MVRTFKQFKNSSRSEYINKEPTWTFHIGYVTQMNFNYVQLFATLYDIASVQSYVISIKHPHTFVHMV